MKKLSLFIIVSLLTNILFSQVQKTIPFTLKGAVDANFMQHSFWVDGDICSISRISGKQNRYSSYAVTRYDDDLNELWRSSVTTSDTEDLLDFFELDNSIYVLINGYNPETRLAYLTKAKIHKTTGDWMKTDTLISQVLPEWKVRSSKATVKESFQNAILSIQYAKYVVPLEYKFQVKFSPDSSKVMVYQFDYSKKELWVKARVFDKELKIIEEGSVPVDDHFICYGMDVNNEAEVVLYKANEIGRVVAVRFHLSTDDFKYVALYTTNSTRDNLTVWQQDVDNLYIAKLNRKHNSFVGLTFSRFNFSKEKVDETRFEPFRSDFKTVLLEEMKKEKVPNIDKDWHHFELTNFFIDKDSNKIIIVEERNILSSDFEYEPEMVEKRENWTPRIGRVKAGILLIYVFNKDNKLIYKKGVVKNQDIDATDGLNTISYSVNHNESNGLLQFVMAKEGRSTTLNQIRFIEIDYLNNKVNRDYNLSNPDKLVLSRPFTLFKDDTLYFVGKKGLLAKKTYFVKYKL
jgi:hypothetical protein